MGEKKKFLVTLVQEAEHARKEFMAIPRWRYFKREAAADKYKSAIIRAALEENRQDSKDKIQLTLTDIVFIDRALLAHTKCGRDFDDEETRQRIMLEVINNQLAWVQGEE